MQQWFAENWFAVIESVGITGGFLLAARAFTLDRRARRSEVFLSITTAHRELWDNLIQKPELARILNPDADPVLQPPSPAEERLVMLIIVHLSAVHLAIENGVYESSAGLESDIRDLLSLPIPAAIAGKVLPYQRQSFQRYLRRLMLP